MIVALIAVIYQYLLRPLCEKFQATYAHSEGRVPHTKGIIIDDPCCWLKARFVHFVSLFSIPNVFALIWTYLHCDLWVWSFQFTQIQLKLLMWDNFSNYKVLCMLSVSLSRMADSFQTLVSTDPPHIQIDMVWHSINSTFFVLERGIMGYFSILQAKWLMSE